MSRLILPVFFALALLTGAASAAQQTVLYEHFTAVW
jgi:hypothetical protein